MNTGLIDKQARTAILAVAKAYMKATRLGATTVSRRFHSNHDFLEKFEQGPERGGCSVTTYKFDEMMVRFSREWPDNAKWPAAVPRPLRKTTKSRIPQATQNGATHGKTTPRTGTEEDQGHRRTDRRKRAQGFAERGTDR